MNTVTGERWREIRAHFDELVELDHAERQQRLSRIGDTDPKLQRAVESLIAFDAMAGARLQRIEFGIANLLTGDARTTDPPSDPLLLTGRTVSHFQISGPLASGGMGVVYRAEDTRLQRTVALKFPLPGRDIDAVVKDRFLREAQSAGALEHLNVCSIYEAGETADGQLFLAMPLYAGETLKSRLARDGALPVDRALEIARQIAEGLACAHTANIVHRDLKPGNLMLLPDGTVKILDFGLAKAADVSHCTPGALRGTAAYMAPEQIAGDAVDERADLWALGVVLHEMLTGKRPFSGERDVDLANAIVHDTPTAPSTLRSEIPPAVDDVVLRLLHKDAACRYATALQAAGDLRGLARDGQAARQHTRPLRSRPAGLSRRHGIVAAAVAATGIAALLLVVPASRSRTPILAVGSIKAVDLPVGDPAAGALPELMSTQLAQTNGLQLISRARMHELRARAGSELSAARYANAGLLLEGELYRSGPDGYRLELRQVDVATGRVGHAHTLHAADAIRMAHAAASAFSRTWGLAPPPALQGVHSVTARALYERGLQALYRNADLRHAFSMFTAALDEDSTFTMAAFYAGRTAHVYAGDSLTKYLARAEQLSINARDFERLLINAYVAHSYNEPRELAVAETLAVRYLKAPEAANRLAVARYWHGDFLGAVAEHQRVLALHPALLKASRQNCDACVEAYNGIVVAYWAADSLAAAVRVARQWTRHSPAAPAAWTTLATVLEYADLYGEAGAAREKAAALAPPNVLSDLARVPGYLRAGDFAAADRLLDVAVQSIDATVAREALWWQVISLRYQGRYGAALRVARQFRQLEEARGNRATARIAQAAVLQDAGKAALAAATYDTLVQLLPDLGRASRNARERAWWLTHVGDAAAAAGDTIRLLQLVDSVRLVGALSGYGRDPRLYRHLRGLVYQARGDLAAAETEFRAAIYSTTAGYTRTNLALARVLMGQGQPRAAVGLLQAALRGSLDGSPFYVTRTELHETLARAWEQAGQRDSAAYHYGRVVKAWQKAEPPLHGRRQELQTRLAAARR